MRIAVIDDHESVREAMAAALRLVRPGCIVDIYPSGEAAVRDIPCDPPDAVLVDLVMDGVSGIETIRRLRVLLPQLPLLVLTLFETSELVIGAVQAGASGYLLKGTPTSAIAESIEQAIEGAAPISSVAARHMFKELQARSPGPRVDTRVDFGLTEREREVVELLVAGRAYTEIARELAIGVGTVQSHVRNIYRKLGVSSKTEAAVLALEHGIVGRGN